MNARHWIKLIPQKIRRFKGFLNAIYAFDVAKLRELEKPVIDRFNELHRQNPIHPNTHFAQGELAMLKKVKEIVKW